MPELSLILMFIAAVVLIKQSHDYKNHKIVNRYVQVDRLRDLDEFCRFAAKDSLINASIVIALLLFNISEVYFGYQIGVYWQFALIMYFIVRTFRFPRTFERFYKPTKVDKMDLHKSSVVEDRVDK